MTSLPGFPTIICTYHLSNKKMAFTAIVRDGKIINADLTVRIFIGQPFTNFIKWMEKQGPTNINLISTEIDSIQRNPYR